MKYKNFRTIARVLVILAWLGAIIAFLLGVVTGIAGGGATIVFGIILGIVGGLIIFAYLYATAQFIYVILDIERNTRATVKALYEEVETEEEIEGKVNINTETEEGK